MTKPLSALTEEELWQLFPVILRPHDPRYADWYEEERQQILNAVGRACIRRISHIGSTAVPGLLAKPTVDILLEITPGSAEPVTDGLCNLDYIVDAQPEKPPPHLVFYKGYTPKGFAEKVFHVHVRYLGDWDELYFRDWLLASPETLQAYAELKRRLAEPFRHDRDGYTEAKGDFIREAVRQARERFPGRYALV